MEMRVLKQIIRVNSGALYNDCIFIYIIKISSGTVSVVFDIHIHVACKLLSKQVTTIIMLHAKPGISKLLKFWCIFSS